ncbi:MAG: hypothetical protein HY094_01195 [Candidatus Melainabacteria bacterium]|nr:hypothetical protein [Candidatus Melainabacteria bacterium]
MIAKFLLVLLFISSNNHCYANQDYQAIVLGKIIKKEVKVVNNTYLTEYKLKTKKWFFKKDAIKKTKFITIKVLGADLPEKGIVIKASTTPDYIPVGKEAIFFLEQNKLRQPNIFTLSKNGVIYNDSSFKLKPSEIEHLYQEIEEL